MLLAGEQGPRLGEQANIGYHEHQMALKEDDLLVFLTDGILEARSSNGREYGERRLLKEVLRNYAEDPKNAISRILDDVQTFLAGAKFDDDITLVLAKIIDQRVGKET